MVRNIRLSRLVAFHDIDELIVPQSSFDVNIPTIIDKQLTDDIAGFVLARLNFYTTEHDNRPPVAFHRLLAVANVDARNCCSTKCIVRPNRVLIQNVHFVGRMTHRRMHTPVLDHRLAQVYHYNSAYASMTDANTLVDRIATVYGSVFIHRYNRILRLIDH